MKKIINSIFVLVAVVLLATGSKVFASSAKFAKIDATSGAYNITVKVQKGWNLIPIHNTGLFKYTQESIQALGDPSAFFVYLPLKKKYVNTREFKNDTDVKEFQDNVDYLRLGAEWLYSEKNIDVPYFMKGIPSDLKVSLYQGWNLMAVPPQFYDKSFGWGECAVEKIYLWDSVAQNWMSLPSEGIAQKFLEEVGDGDFVGDGIAVKIQNNCSLGKIKSIAPLPPSIPN